MYEAGVITAEREVGYFEEDVVVEQHHYEMNYDTCKTLMKQEDSELTDDEALLQCIYTDMELQSIDISEERQENLETFNQLTQIGVLNKVSTVFAIKNVSVNEVECRNLAAMAGFEDSVISNLCTGNNLLSAGYPYKFLYEQGVITGDVMNINHKNEVNEVEVKNDVSKTIDILTISKKAFSGKTLTSVTFSPKLVTIEEDAFNGVGLGYVDFSNANNLEIIGE